ncbi:MAG: selenium cofactor biosynthesis protein YqeC [Firmicutes bacterium]|nr:selenium cofactor biosynthesis protein YqeC [Bacillota bacterium]
MNKQFILDQFKGGHIYSFIGAGGKTSAIKEVANILSFEGYKVVITTTTKISIEEFSDYKVEIKKYFNIIDLNNDINVLVSGTSGIKYLGFKKIDFENLANIPIDTIILIEGDGSKRLPFKVPYEYEPVVPDNSVKTFLFFSAKVIGEKISTENTYNLEKVKEILADCEMVYTKKNILKIISEGWLTDINYRNLKVIINQGDLGLNNYLIKEILYSIYKDFNIGAYLVSIKEKQVYQSFDDKIGVLILAAGEGKRMGGIKQLMDFKGSTFLEETIKKYSSFAQEVVVTLGYYKDEIKENIKEIGFTYQEIKNYKVGMSASFKEAIDFNTDYFLVTPCDLPLIEENTIDLLIKTYRQNRGSILVPRFMGIKGHPVIFPIEMQASFQLIDGDKGARDIIKDKGCLFIDVDDPGIIADIDTFSDYIKIKEVYND